MAELRYKCEECGWIGLEAAIDRVADPKPTSGAIWSICPQCRAAEQFTNICDEPGCDEDATVGEPTEQGYRRVCFDHSSYYRAPSHRRSRDGTS